MAIDPGRGADPGDIKASLSSPLGGQIRPRLTHGAIAPGGCHCFGFCVRLIPTFRPVRPGIGHSEAWHRNNQKNQHNSNKEGR